MSTLTKVIGAPLSHTEPITVVRFKHTCRCGHVWINDNEMPRFCPACRDPNWNKPRQWLKPSAKKNAVRRESRLDAEYRQPKPSAQSSEALDEERRDRVIAGMYRDQRRHSSFLACLAKDFCPSLYLYGHRQEVEVQ